MKKIIITIAIASFISLGFTLIENNNNSSEGSPVETVNSQDFVKANLSVEKNEKRLASWD